MSRQVSSIFRSQILKTEQQSAVMELLIGKDVFVNLPTGFEKSLIYQVLPVCISMALEKESQVATGSLRRSSIRHSSLILKRTRADAVRK